MYHEICPAALLVSSTRETSNNFTNAPMQMQNATSITICDTRFTQTATCCTR